MSLQRLFQARSVAVVGASRTPTKRGYQAIRTLLEERYEGEIHAINPREQSVLGLPCHASLRDVEGDIDLALITTPARTIPDVLRDCAAKGVAGAVVVAGGFGEVGPEGKRLEEEMVAVAREGGVRLIGPNTSGMMNVHSHMNLAGIRGVPRGDIALLTQSGNMALSLITEASVKSKQGFTHYVGVGNEADIGYHEYLEYLRDDERTRAILMYVEGMRDGRAFLQVAYETTRHKPVVMLKSGRSERGASAAGSHTGALAGMSQVARTAFQRAGIVVVEDSDELLPAAEALASLPPIRRHGVAILADGGGHATIAADVLTDLGVEIAELGERTTARLRALLPPAASVLNPIDVAGATDAHPELFAECARVLLQDHKVGGLLLVGLFGGYGIRFAEELAYAEELAAHQMGQMVAELRKPIVVHSLYKFARPHAIDILRHYHIPVNDSVEVACRCIGVLHEYGRHLQSYQASANFVFDWRAKARPRGEEIIAAARAEGRSALLETEAKELIALHGADVPQEVLAADPDEAVRVARRFRKPVAMKVVSPQILHKSDADGVQLGIEGDVAVRRAYDRILAGARRHDPDAEIRGVLITPMAKPGVEVIVGTKVDDQFGPVILFGLGGVLVELLQDVVFRVLPISDRTARHMIEDIHGVKLLDGYRGRTPADRKAIVRLLKIVSELIESYPEIRSMDLNPVIVHPEGLTVVDARVLLAGEPSGT